MPKLLDEKPMLKVTLRLYEEDWEILKSLSTNEMKTNELARRIIHTYVTQAKDRIRRRIDEAASIGTGPSAID